MTVIVGPSIEVESIRNLINNSKDCWRTARGIAFELQLDPDLVKIILEENRLFIHADAFGKRLYCTKGRYFRWSNFLHIIGDFLSQQITITSARPTHEAWLFRNKKALASVKHGLDQARKREFADPPDLDEDEKLAAMIADGEQDFSDEEIRLAIAVADRVEQGKERVFTFEESIADLGSDEEGEAPFEDSFVATVNELAVKTQQSKAEVLASALNLYHRFVHDETLRLVIQGEVNSHHPSNHL